MLLKQRQEVIALKLGTLSQQLIFKAEFPAEVSGNSAQTLLLPDGSKQNLQSQEEKSVGYSTKNRL